MEYAYNNVFVTIDDERKTISQWCRIYGISPQCVYDRTKRGMPLDLAIVKPVRPYRSNKEVHGRNGDETDR